MEDVIRSVPADARINVRSGLEISNNRCNSLELIVASSPSPSPDPEPFSTGRSGGLVSLSSFDIEPVDETN